LAAAKVISWLFNQVLDILVPLNQQNHFVYPRVKLCLQARALKAC